MENSGFTYKSFLKYCQQIIDTSNKLSDGWLLHTTQNAECGIYISKKFTVPLSDNQNTVVTIEVHIVYHISYGVPILCFNVWRPDGSLLTMEEYWNASTASWAGSNMYETLTQMDHPVLCRPFLTLHPCKTYEILNSFSAKSNNLLISWLSVVGPYVKLDLLNAYIACCF